MPRKQKKAKEERIAENYFPVDESDLKHTTEKKEKETNQNIPKITIEKTYKKERPKEIVEKRKELTKTKVKEYHPPKINLKKQYQLPNTSQLILGDIRILALATR